MPTGPLPPSDNYLGDGDRTTGEFQSEINNLQNWARKFQAQLDALSSTTPGEAFNRGVGDSAGQLTARGVGTSGTELVDNDNLDSRLGTTGNLGSSATQDYEEIDVNLDGDFNNVPVRFVRIGTRVTMTFLEAPTFVSSQSTQRSTSNIVPSSMRWSGAGTPPFFSVYSFGSSSSAKIGYVSVAHRIDMEFRDWSGSPDSLSTAIGLGAGSISWNTGT